MWIAEVYRPRKNGMVWGVVVVCEVLVIISTLLYYYKATENYEKGLEACAVSETFC